MSTLFLLMAEYGQSDVPLETVAARYFAIHSKRDVNARAARQWFPFPVRRAGGERSPWVVSVVDLAAWIDADREQARQDWEQMRNAS